MGGGLGTAPNERPLVLADALPPGPQGELLVLAEAVYGAARFYLYSLQQGGERAEWALGALHALVPNVSRRLLEQADLAHREQLGSTTPHT